MLVDKYFSLVLSMLDSHNPIYFSKNIYFYLYEHKAICIDITWKIFKTTYFLNDTISHHQKEKLPTLNVLGDTNTNNFIVCIFHI